MLACLLTAVIMLGMSGVIMRPPPPLPTFLATPGLAQLAQPLPTVDQSNPLARGKLVYDTLCAHCHGYQGEGEGRNLDPDRPDTLGYLPVPRHDREGHTWMHPDQLLIASIRLGLPNPLYRYQMPAFSEQALSDQQLADMLLYIKQWWTDEQRAAQAAVTERLRQALTQTP